MFLAHLSCTSCGLNHDWGKLQNLCTACRKPLFAVYDLERAGRALKRDALLTRAEKSLWRYRELLPVPIETSLVSLSEGGTPLLRAGRFGVSLQMQDLRIKDESQNPTQSFKARGMSVAVSMAKYLGASKLVAPSAGNAGGALAAYAARAGLEAHVFMPRDTPRSNIIECREFGAYVTLIDGLITDCAAEIARRKEDWFDVSTLKEPYRIEGKKRSVTNWRSSSSGNYQTLLFIPPEAGPALSETGKRSMKWRHSVGLAKNGHGCFRCRPRAARPSFAHSKPEKTAPPNSPTPTRLLPDYVFPKR